MTRRAKYRRALLILLAASVVFSVFFTYYTILDKIPDKIHIVVDEPETFHFLLPFKGSLTEDGQEVAFSGESNIPQNKLNLSDNDGLTLYSSDLGVYQMGLSLFGWLPVKNVEIEVVEPKFVVPGGMTIGLYLEDNGIMVIGTGEVADISGVNHEPAYGAVKSGDYIIAINDLPIAGKADMIARINEVGANPIVLTLRRQGEEVRVKVDAIQSSESEYKLGIWVRDDTQGIGTLSYIDQEGGFGALGHGISDVDTGKLVEVSGGTLYETEIRSVEKGRTGKPGSMSGVIYYQDSAILGTIATNTDEGVFGTVNDKLFTRLTTDAVQIGYRQEVRTGDAIIRCNVNGTVREYDIEILKVDTSNSNKNKGMVIQVVDDELLEITGGIVQGMSGSPILQDGKIIGAVTHVFIQDSTKGYGIFIENMLETQKKD